MVGGVVVTSRWSEDVGGCCDKHNRSCLFTGICPGEATLTFIGRDTIVNSPSSRRRHVGLVHEGILGVFRLWPTGEETLASLWLPGHVFGIMSALILQVLARQVADQLRMSARPKRKGPEKALAHILAVLAESGGIMVPNGTLIARESVCRIARLDP